MESNDHIRISGCKLNLLQVGFIKMDLNWVVVVMLTLVAATIVARLLSLPFATFFSVVLVGVILSMISYIAFMSILTLAGIPITIVQSVAVSSAVLIMTFAIYQGIKRQKIIDNQK